MQSNLSRITVESKSNRTCDRRRLSHRPYRRLAPWSARSRWSWPRDRTSRTAASSRTLVSASRRVPCVARACSRTPYTARIATASPSPIRLTPQPRHLDPSSPALSMHCSEDDRSTTVGNSTYAFLNLKQATLSITYYRYRKDCALSRDANRRRRIK